MRSMIPVQECAAQNLAKGVKGLECLPPEATTAGQGDGSLADSRKAGPDPPWVAGLEKSQGSMVEPRREAATPIPGGWHHGQLFSFCVRNSSRITCFCKSETQQTAFTGSGALLQWSPSALGEVTHRPRLLLSHAAIVSAESS